MEVRIDPITHQAILFATNRAQRPHFGTSLTPHPPLDRHRTGKEHKKVDPFAVGQEALNSELWADSDNPQRQKNDPDWRIRVIPNKYPVVEHHEVIILTSSRNKDIAHSSLKQVERIMHAFLARSKAHQGQGQVFLYANHGGPAGASISHPHAQLVVLATVPPAVDLELQAVAQHYQQKEQCLYCQLITKEQKIGRRVIWENEDYILLCPEASGWPYAITLLPKVHQPNFATVRPEQIKPLAQAWQLMMKLYDQVLENPPYNYWIHSVSGHFFHWHVELIPRTKVLAGIELGAGIMVNDRITPEDAAAQFRAALKDLK